MEARKAVLKNTYESSVSFKSIYRVTYCVWVVFRCHVEFSSKTSLCFLAILKEVGGIGGHPFWLLFQFETLGVINPYRSFKMLIRKGFHSETLAVN